MVGRFFALLFAYLLQFFLMLSVSSIVVILIAKIIPRYRRKPLPQFLNVALVVTVVLAGLFVFGLWYADKASKHDDLKNDKASSKQSLQKTP